MKHMSRDCYDCSAWTGEPDPAGAKIVIGALVLGAIGFLIIGAVIL